MPLTKGTIYLNNVNNCTINLNTFKFNDAGHIFDKIQDVGFLQDPWKKYGNVPRASVIYIDNGCKNIKVESNNFNNNSLNFLHDVIKKYNNDLVNFFPPLYFK